MLQSLEAVSGMSELYLLMMESVKGSLAVMSGVLVIAFLGLLVSLVLVVGVKTQQRLLLLPWQVGNIYTVPKVTDFPRYNMYCSIMFSSTFHVISRKCGLLFGQCMLYRKIDQHCQTVFFYVGPSNNVHTVHKCMHLFV